MAALSRPDPVALRVRPAGQPGAELAGGTFAAGQLLEGVTSACVKAMRSALDGTNALLDR